MECARGEGVGGNACSVCGRGPPSWVWGVGCYTILLFCVSYVSDTLSTTTLFAPGPSGHSQSVRARNPAGVFCTVIPGWKRRIPSDLRS